MPVKKNSAKPAIDDQKLKPFRTIEKPGDSEFPKYAHIYIDLLPDDGLILQHLAENLEFTRNFFASIPEDRLLHRYVPGKWTIKEILCHLIDDQRIYVYRALRFARNDTAELPGFDQGHYAMHSGANQRSLDDLLDEFTFVRHSTIAFFNSLDDAALLRSGIADGKRARVRALAYHIAGHELRHINIIKERYLGGSPGT